MLALVINAILGTIALRLASVRLASREKIMSKWTVWVGGSEVNLCYLSQTQAENMAQAWKDKGYDDVVAEEIK